MSADANKAVVRRLLVEALDQGDLDVAEALLAPEYGLHDPPVPFAVVGPAGYKRFQAMDLTAFPDRRLTVEEPLTVEDRVVTR